MSGKEIKLLGVTGVISIWLIYITDLFVDIREMFGSGFWHSFININSLKLNLASYALFLFPLLLGVLWIIYKALRPAGKWAARIPTLMLMFSITSVNIFLHSSYTYFAVLAKAQNEADGVTKETLLNILVDFNAFKLPFSVIFILLFLIPSIWIFILIVSGKTHLPRWAGFANPVTGVILNRFLEFTLPAVKDVLYPVLIPAFWFAVMITLIVYIMWSKLDNMISVNETQPSGLAK